MKTTNSIERAILALSRNLFEIDDFCLLPTVLQQTLEKFIHIDWLGLYTTAKSLDSYTVTTNPHLPFNWDTLYQEIAPYDNFREISINLGVGQALIQKEVSDPYSESERFCLEFAKKYTDSVHYLGMPVVKDAESMALLGCYRSEERQPFTNEDKQLLMGVGPLLGTAVKMMFLHKRFEFKRVAYDQILEDTGVRPIFLDENLRLIDLPLTTLIFFRDMFADDSLQGIPNTIDTWIKQKIAPDGFLVINTGPWKLRIKAHRGDIVCNAYIFTTSEKDPILALKFDSHGHLEDFSCLTHIGLTYREIMALSYLPLGYTNKQIAMAMGISENGVKKHLKNISHKLGAQGRAEILYRALSFKTDYKQFPC